MFIVECLTELRDLLKDNYTNGGIESVNFHTQTGRFYYEDEESLLEDIGQLSELIKIMEGK